MKTGSKGKKYMADGGEIAGPGMKAKDFGGDVGGSIKSVTTISDSVKEEPKARSGEVAPMGQSNSLAGGLASGFQAGTAMKTAMKKMANGGMVGCGRDYGKKK